MCGLFGFIGKEKTKIDITELLTLGIDNDNRGGDSCGIFIDGEVEYGLDENKLFFNFYDVSKLINNLDEAKLILGHCRKTSVGKTSLETAQPVTITNPETGLIDFVAIHNGTICNYKELAEKYLSGYTEGMTDSQVMTHIVFKHGFNVLEEYDGSAAFVFADYRTPNRVPSVYIFKGCSKEYSSSVKETEERPLSLLKDDNGMWFSSLSDYLYLKTFKNNKKVQDIPCNVVILVDGKSAYKIQDIDRSKRVQRNYNYKSSNYNYTTYNYGNYEIYPKTPESTVKKPEVKIQTTLDKVQLIDDLYYLNNSPCHGMYELNADGSISSHGFGREFWFYHGVIVYGKHIFNALLSLQTDWCDMTTDEFFDGYKEIIYTYSPMLLCDNEHFDVSYRQYCSMKTGTPIPYSGKLYLPFTPHISKEVKYESGYISGALMVDLGSSMAKFYKALSKKCKKYDKIEIDILIENIFNLFNYGYDYLSQCNI